MGNIKLPELHPQFLEDIEDIIDLEKAKAEPEETVEIADFWAKVEGIE